MARKNNGKWVDDLVIEDAELIFKSNFRGERRQYNDEGKRNFTVIVPEDRFDVDKMIEDGWNIKISKSKNPDYADEPRYYLKVNVRFDPVPPREFWLISNAGTPSETRVAITENNVDILDGRHFEKIDLVIHPNVKRDWESGQNEIRGVYLAEGWFYITTSVFAQRWASEHEQ